MANKGTDIENEKKELCDRCRKIPATAFVRIQKSSIGCEYEFGPTKPYQLIEGPNAFEELKLSAAAGCGLCKLFQDALEISAYHPEEQLRRQPEYCKGGIRLQRKRTDNPEITFGWYCHRRIHARLVIRTDQSPTRSIEPGSFVVETESDSPANFALARLWLAECCKDHLDCREPLESDLPRRLLDVAIPSKPGIIRLVSAPDLSTNGRANYATLSHCWGSFRPLQTKKDNLRSHMQEIPESRLPQTFYDAVRTTRELGLRYLWIDSLCIVQDDPKDFGAECARMNIIFANALCTISASDARDCRDGLFRSRTLKPIQLIYVSDGSEPTLTVIVQPAFSRTWMQGLKGPLQSRAWVLQERHLSPRVIHYTKKCLMWECRTATASEHLQKMQAKAGNASNRSSTRFLDGRRLKLGLEDPRSSLLDNDFRSLHARWYRTVGDYSNRVLSRPEDKLSAFSGFAAEWKRIKPDDEYFAGVWKSDIFRGLAWRSNYAQYDVKSRPPELTATWPPPSPFKGIPSWSWAAFDGPVTHYKKSWFNTSYSNEPSVSEVGQQPSSPDSWSPRLHGVCTTIDQPNPFGHVSNGEITVSSWSIVVTLNESDFSPIFPRPKRYRLHPDMKSIFDGVVIFDYDPFYLPRTQVRLLQLGQAQFGGHGGHGGPWVCGLALLQLPTDELKSNQDFYRRVGMFKVEDHSFWVLRRAWKAITII